MEFVNFFQSVVLGGEKEEEELENDKNYKKKRSKMMTPLSSSSSSSMTTTSIIGGTSVVEKEKEKDFLEVVDEDMNLLLPVTPPSSGNSGGVGDKKKIMLSWITTQMQLQHAPEPELVKIMAHLKGGVDESPEIHLPPKSIRLQDFGGIDSAEKEIEQQQIDFLQMHLQKLMIEDVNSINFDPIRYRGPTTESNWVLPDRLMMGAYPASLCDDQHYEVSKRLLRCGIRTFVCLQDEYDHTATPEQWKLGQRIRPYIYDTAEILRTNESFEGSSQQLELLHVAIKDCSITMDQVVQELAEEVCYRLCMGESIYVHCWGGHGRTGTLVAIVIGMLFGLDANEALARTQHFHDLRYSPLGVQSPQTLEQRNQVRRVLTDYHSAFHGLLFSSRLQHGLYHQTQSPYVIYKCS
jgi:hypothetical protein